MFYFISDLHLGVFERTKDRKREDLFIQLLEEISKDAKTIFLVGDIFDFWFEYKTVIPAYFYRTLTSIDKICQKGIQIEYLMGNHDFGHKDFFKKEFNIEIHRDDISREINGKRFFISHGDGKAKNDFGYKVLKSVLRNPISNKLYRIVHPDIGIGIASGSSKKSRKYTDQKDFGSDDGMKEFAIKKIDEGFDFVVMGHRHKAEVHPHNKGTYINLGDWINEPTFGIFDGEKFELLKVKDFLNQRINL